MHFIHGLWLVYIFKTKMVAIGGFLRYGFFVGSQKSRDSAVCQGPLSCRRHIGKREDSGDEADIVPSIIVIQTLRPNFKHLYENQVSSKHAVCDSKSVRFVADMNSNKKLVIVRIHIFRVGILKVLKEYDVTQSKFCHNWGIPLALMIGRELCSITLQTMEMAWWWRNLFFSFSHTRFSEKLQRKWTLNLSMLKKQIDNNFRWSVLLSTKKWRQTCCAWFHLSFEHFC